MPNISDQQPHSADISKKGSRKNADIKHSNGTLVVASKQVQTAMQSACTTKRSITKFVSKRLADV
jgi:hypothetical protein